MIFVWREKYVHNHSINTIIQTMIRGFALYQIEIRCSIDSKIISKNHSTKIRELIVDSISNVLLFHQYIKVKTT